MQTIRFVGGPYHGRTLGVSEGNPYVSVATLRDRVASFVDGTLPSPFAPLPVDYVRYYREWLERKTATLYVREQVMLLEGVSPHSSEAQQRWQELRAV